MHACLYFFPFPAAIIPVPVFAITACCNLTRIQVTDRYRITLAIVVDFLGLADADGKYIDWGRVSSLQVQSMVALVFVIKVCTKVVVRLLSIFFVHFMIEA